MGPSAQDDGDDDGAIRLGEQVARRRLINRLARASTSVGRGVARLTTDPATARMPPMINGAHAILYSDYSDVAALQAEGIEIARPSSDQGWAS
jgi:hypothetical protein